MRHPLLLAGAAAGPVYIGVGTIEAVVRDGYDIRVHALSLLANGSFGWIHSTMMVVTGGLTILGVLGLRRALPRAAFVGLLVYGLGVVAAGFMRADPSYGFPIGTPDGPPTTASWHGVGHFAAGGIGFIGLIVACLVVARRAEGRWRLFSTVTGLGYLGAFVGIAAGGGNAAGNLVFTAAVILGWAWITALMLSSSLLTRPFIAWQEVPA